jgi:hypothetical protein
LLIKKTGELKGEGKNVSLLISWVAKLLSGEIDQRLNRFSSLALFLLTPLHFHLFIVFSYSNKEEANGGGFIKGGRIKADAVLRCFFYHERRDSDDDVGQFPVS